MPREPLGADARRAAMLALLDRLDDTPALIVSDLSETLAANAMARTLLGDHQDLAWPRSTQLYRWFAEPEHRPGHREQDIARLSESLVAELRAATARRPPDDPRGAELVRLCSTSDEFAHLWSQRAVGLRRADAKVFVHPTIGELDLLCHTLHTLDGSQHLLWFTARAGTDSDERLALLRVVGAESMTAR